MLLDKPLCREEITSILNGTLSLLPQEKEGLRQVLGFLETQGYNMNEVLLGRSLEGGPTLLVQAVAWDSLHPATANEEEQMAYRFAPSEPFPARVAAVLEMAERTFSTAGIFHNFLERQYFGHSAKQIAENAIAQGGETTGISEGVVRIIEHFEQE